MPEQELETYIEIDIRFPPKRTRVLKGRLIKQGRKDVPQEKGDVEGELKWEKR